MRPFIISFDHACNNRCRFCSQADLPSPASAPDFRERLEAARAAGHGAVDVIGGEPTLHESLPLWIAAAKRLGFERIGLQTNGRRLAYGGYARALAADGLTANIRLPLEEQEFRCEMRPDAFWKVPNKFGDDGWTTIDLSALDLDDLKVALTAAWRHQATPPRGRGRKR